MKFTALLTATLTLNTPLAAQELSVVGSWSSLPLHKQYEAPFWTETLPEASDGEISVSLTTHNQMNLGVGDVFRLLGQGVYDVGMTVADYAVADAPEPEGIDVPLLALMVVTIPIVVPLVVAQGFDPIWFGILMIVLIEMALITPPVGLNFYVVQGGRMSEVMVGAAPYAFTMLVMAGLLIAFPQIALFLPNAVR